MNPLKKLLGQTAVYGLSSIFARFLNFLLVPIHTYLLDKHVDGEKVADLSSYGTVTELYAYAAFFIVILPHGMETAFFRFSKDHDKTKVYSMAYLSVFLVASFFLICALLFSEPIARFLHIANHSEYVSWFGIILAFDAFASIPFAFLREEEKAKAFAIIKSLNIFVNVTVTLFFLSFCGIIYYEYKDSVFYGFVDAVYNPQMKEGYIFIANLCASTVTLFFLFPYFKKLKPVFDAELWKKMLKYALPMLLLGLAGVINETLDRALLDHLLPGSDAYRKEQIGIYGACYKLTMVITISVQAFRYAAEPFFFKESSDSNSKKVFADVMHYFVIFLCAAFLGTLMYLDILKYFISPAYHEGLKVIPILLMANVFLGMLYNLSLWYKLTDRTKMGAWISIAGALVTIVLNITWIPTLGYVGSAWATLICYLFMAVVSYFLGQKYYPVPYNVPKILGYLVFVVALYFSSIYLNKVFAVHELLINTLIFLTFAVVVFVLEKPKKVVS